MYNLSLWSNVLDLELSDIFKKKYFQGTIVWFLLKHGNTHNVKWNEKTKQTKHINIVKIRQISKQI